MRLRTTLLTSAFAAAGMYFFDPERGAARRENLNATLGRSKPKPMSPSTSSSSAAGPANAASPLWTPRSDERDAYNDAPSAAGIAAGGNGLDTATATPAPSDLLVSTDPAGMDPSIGDPASSAIASDEPDLP